VDTVLLGEDDSTDVETIFTERPANYPVQEPKATVRKSEDRTTWN